MSKNPFIEPHDYYNEYNANIDKFKESPEFIEFDKLCHYVFTSTNEGKKLLSILIDRYVISRNANVGAPNYVSALIFADGIKEGYLKLSDAVKSHEQRIKAEVNK